jgi:integrase
LGRLGSVVAIVKGEKRGRKGWVVDWRDAGQRRRWKTCRTYREAVDFYAEAVKLSRQPLRSSVDADILMRDYAAKWLEAISVTLKPRSLDAYSASYRLHIGPTLGLVRVRNVTRWQVRELVTAKLKSGMARKTVAFHLAILRTLLSAAVEDQIILANPATRLSKAFKLGVETEPEEIKALTGAQIAAFLEAIRSAVEVGDRRFSTFFLLLARSGVRVSEGLALQEDDLDFIARKIRVSRGISRGRESTPKSGKARSVDMSTELTAALRHHLVEQKRLVLALGKPELKWVFTTPAGALLDEGRIRRVMRRGLKAAGLPMHFSCHGFRHSFASLLLQRGESVSYVSEQLGHFSIELTSRVYGRWLPKLAVRGGVSALDSPEVVRDGEQMVSNAGLGGGVMSQVAGISDGLTDADLECDAKSTRTRCTRSTRRCPRRC